MTIEEIYKTFYLDKNYSGINEMKDMFSDFRSFNMLAKSELYSGNLNEAYKYFDKSQNIYGCAYCKFLSSQLEKSKVLLNLIKDYSSAAKWLLFLISVIEDDITEYPTYFQIRNFYEQDLDMLFYYKQQDYINKILSGYKCFEYFNREIHKYNARVLMNNNLLDIAKKMLKKSLDISYNDPETHYMLANIYMMEDDKMKALNEYLISSKICGDYMPAIKKLKDFSDGLYNLNYGVK